MSDPVLEVRDLVVEYRQGSRRSRAVDGVSFHVEPGECVGFIGANGAGKSSTMKTMMGFIFPASGTVRVFGETAGSVESRRRIGYLPEVALYYPFMKARELLELYGGLQGLSRATLKKRIPEILERVGLGGKGEILLKNFSKGMQQRVGIAQAIIAEPEALILDELSSGLDPLGRHDLREVMLELKRAGRTIFFSSHELNEVETLCDRVIMIHRGRIVTQASVRDLMKPLEIFDLAFSLPEGTTPPDSVAALSPTRDGGGWTARATNAVDYTRALGDLAAAGATGIEASARVRSLEEYFIELVRSAGPGSDSPGTRGAIGEARP